MTEGDILLRDIIASPSDDGLRLILADWLADHGQEERADWIRDGVHNPQVKHQCRRLRAEDSASGGRPPKDVWPGAYWAAESGLPPDGEFIWRRGFVEWISLPLQAWLDQGPAIWAAHPVESVECPDVDIIAGLVPGDSAGLTLSFLSRSAMLNVIYYRDEAGFARARAQYDDTTLALVDHLDAALRERADTWQDRITERASGWFSAALLSWAKSEAKRKAVAA